MTRSTFSRIEVIGVPKRDLRLVAVVDDDQLDVGARSAARDQARVHLAGERAVLSLRRIADPVAFAPADLARSAGSGCSSTFSMKPQ